MKVADRDTVRWLIEAFWSEHKAQCRHYGDLHPDECPTKAKFEEALAIVQKG